MDLDDQINNLLFGAIFWVILSWSVHVILETMALLLPLENIYCYFQSNNLTLVITLSFKEQMCNPWLPFVSFQLLFDR
jgi:hypothetical protein